MDFQDFQRLIPKLIEVPLQGYASHMKMAPQERKDFLKAFTADQKQPKTAAVLMLLYPKQGKTHLVLIERNAYEGVHSAQIAFPGGKFEPNDRDFEVTALRESEEEIGIQRAQVTIVKSFTPLYIPPSNFMVHPFLGLAKEEIHFVRDAKEVASIIELPLEDFLSDHLLFQTRLTTSYATNILVPAFKINQHIVWGATAMIMSELKEVLRLVFK